MRERAVVVHPLTAMRASVEGPDESTLPKQTRPAGARLGAPLAPFHPVGVRSPLKWSGLRRPSGGKLLVLPARMMDSVYVGRMSDIAPVPAGIGHSSRHRRPESKQRHVLIRTRGQQIGAGAGAGGRIARINAAAAARRALVEPPGGDRPRHRRGGYAMSRGQEIGDKRARDAVAHQGSGTSGPPSAGFEANACHRVFQAPRETPDGALHVDVIGALENGRDTESCLPTVSVGDTVDFEREGGQRFLGWQDDLDPDRVTLHHRRPQGLRLVALPVDVLAGDHGKVLRRVRAEEAHFASRRQIDEDSHPHVGRTGRGHRHRAGDGFVIKRDPLDLRGQIVLEFLGHLAMERDLERPPLSCLCRFLRSAHLRQGDVQGVFGVGRAQLQHAVWVQVRLRPNRADLAGDLHGGVVGVGRRRVHAGGEQQ